MGISIEKTAWSGWPNCWRISNGEAELIVTGDIGPRVMRYGFVGGQNFLVVFPDEAGRSGEAEWKLRGGHRIWLAPEDRVLTYAPDNEPAEIAVSCGVLTATQKVEPLTGLRKQLVIRLAESGTEVEILHRMQNTRDGAFELAPWALSMMAQGGTAVTGFPPRGSHADILAPTNPLVMWAFTDLTDPRWKFLNKYLVLRHDPANTDHTKLGHFNEDTWGAYFLGSELFLKWYRADASKRYADMGCSCELFASDAMLEIETLGPLQTLGPGEWAEHTEYWQLHRDIPAGDWSEQYFAGVLNPLLRDRLK